jgi:putative transposase
MARLPRLTVPGHPHHIIQRGNNGQVIFALASDFELMLSLIAENAAKYAVAVHAYVLMPNHFHLLATPNTERGLPQMMQSIGRGYVRVFNQHQGRTGTLWEGRYRSTVIQADKHLLASMAYIDLNPVRADLVGSAQDYPWSSYSHYTGLRATKLLTPHPLMWSLGNTPFAREAAYAEMVRSGISLAQQQKLTHATMSGWALGESDFLVDLQKQTDRRLAMSKPGRPALIINSNQK